MEPTVRAIKNSTVLQVIGVVALVLGAVAAYHQIKLNRMQIALLEHTHKNKL